MRSHELAQMFLSRPDMDVDLCGETQIACCKEAVVDCFDSDEGMVWVLEGDWDE